MRARFVGLFCEINWIPDFKIRFSVLCHILVIVNCYCPLPSLCNVQACCSKSISYFSVKEHSLGLTGPSVLSSDACISSSLRD